MVTAVTGVGVVTGPVDVAAILGSRGLRVMDRSSLLLTAAARLALLDGGLESSDVAVAAGAEAGLAENHHAFEKEAFEEGRQYVNPNGFVSAGLNSAASRVSVFLGLHGPNTSLLAGEATAAQAVLHGSRHLRLGLAPACLAGASYGRGPWMPLLLGREVEEAAAMLLLEPESLARARGARVLARVRGGATAFGGSGGREEARARAARLAGEGEPMASDEAFDGGGALQLVAALAGLQQGTRRVRVEAVSRQGQAAALVLEAP